MSHINPSFDPAEDAVYPEDGNNGEPTKEPVDAPEPDPDHARSLYDAIVALNHASDLDLYFILDGIEVPKLLAIAKIVDEARGKYN